MMEQEQINTLITIAKQNLLKDGSLTSVAFLEGRDKNLEIVALECDKEQFLPYLHKKLLSGAYKSYVLMVESWFVSRNETPKIDGFVVSEQKDRKEAIVVHFQDEIGRQRVTIIPFERNNKEITFLKEQSTDNFEGRFKIWR